MTKSGMLRRAIPGLLFLLAGSAAGCTDGLKVKPDSGGDETCGTIVCSAIPPSTAECATGRCLITLASGHNTPTDIVVDATTVYWRTTYPGQDDTVMAVPLGGGTPVTLASFSYPGISCLAADATSLYWFGDGDRDGGHLIRTPLSGGPPTTLATGQDGGCMAITVDATNVYWLERGPTSSPGDLYRDGTVMTVPLTGGSPTTLASGGDPFALVVDATSVYWTYSGGGGKVMKVPLGGGTPTTLASLAESAFHIAVDATSVYWTTGMRAVEKAPLAVGDYTTLATLGYLESPAGLAVDDTSVYLLTLDLTTGRDAWNVMKLPLAGGTPTILASGKGRPGDLAVDATSIYWTTYDLNAEKRENSVGTVMKLTPK